MAATATAIAPLGPLAAVTDGELAQYADADLRADGNSHFAAEEDAPVEPRSGGGLRETGIGGFGDYYERLRKLPRDDPEWDAFLQEITTHETFLFRDEGQWEWFRKTYLPQCAAAVRGRIPPPVAPHLVGSLQHGR